MSPVKKCRKARGNPSFKQIHIISISCSYGGSKKSFTSWELLGTNETLQIMGLEWDKPPINWCRISQPSTVCLEFMDR